MAIAEPRNLAPGWVGFDFEAAFGCPVKLINDAAPEALGSYRGGSILFLDSEQGFGSRYGRRRDRCPFGAGSPLD